MIRLDVASVRRECLHGATEAVLLGEISGWAIRDCRILSFISSLVIHSVTFLYT